MVKCVKGFGKFHYGNREDSVKSRMSWGHSLASKHFIGCYCTCTCTLHGIECVVDFGGMKSHPI